MTDGTHSKTMSRFVILAIVALAFAGCAAMLTGGDQSLFVDIAR